MTGIPPIKAVMTPFPYWIDIDAPLTQARAMMDDHDIHHLPVMEGEKLVAVLAGAQLVGAAEDAVVRDVCTLGVYVVQLSEPLDRVLLRLADHPTGCAVIVKEDKLAGIFTLSDASRRFGDLLRTLFPRGNPEIA